MGTSTCGIYEALWLARLHHARARALYLHIPFCARKCAYCDFASWATDAADPLMKTYLEGLSRLVRQAQDVGLLDGCATAYVGGGTPTLAGSALSQLVKDVTTRCPGLQELTCEANPDSLTDDLLAELPEAGCTRLSIGVQSLDDDELAQLGRIHTAGQARERVAAAVVTGLDVSCDLMCAIPAQTDTSWTHTLEDLLELGVGHVSVYPLQIEEGTPLAARVGDAPAPWNDTEVQASRMEQARMALEAAGFARYEVASYAEPGKTCTHNKAYWTAMPYLGLGCNASSMLTREGYERLRSAIPSLPIISEDVTRIRLTCTNTARDIAGATNLANLRFEGEALTQRQAAAEDLMLAMRLVDGPDLGLVEHARHVLGESQVDEALEWCARRGLVQNANNRWRPTDQGWLLGNELYGRLWDLAPGEVATL